MINVCQQLCILAPPERNSGQNEHDIKKYDAQILKRIRNLRSPNEVLGNGRLTAVIEYIFIILSSAATVKYYFYVCTALQDDVPLRAHIPRSPPRNRLPCA